MTAKNLIITMQNHYGTSQSELAEQLGIQRASLSTILRRSEDGFSMSLRTFFRIMDALGCDIRIEAQDGWEPRDYELLLNEDDFGIRYRKGRKRE